MTRATPARCTGSYLDHVGFSVRTVADGEVALAAAVEMQPDVIVMDLSMPHLDGITATQRLRLLPRTRNVPVILLTGYPQKAIERRALEAGVDVFLTKPCLPEDLEAHVRCIIGVEEPHGLAALAHRLSDAQHGRDRRGEQAIRRGQRGP